LDFTKNAVLTDRFFKAVKSGKAGRPLALGFLSQIHKRLIAEWITENPEPPHLQERIDTDGCLAKASHHHTSWYPMARITHQIPESKLAF
jgi:hypothetical protein